MIDDINLMIDDIKKYATISIRCDYDLYKAFTEACKLNDISYSKAIRSFMVRFIKSTAYTRFKGNNTKDEALHSNKGALYVRLPRTLLSDFRLTCKHKGLYMSQAVRLFMQDYSCGKYF